MATAKYGLEPIGPQKPDALVKFDVDPSTTAIYRGDVVELVADKGIAQSAATNTDNIGVVVGFYDADGLPALYYPAGSAEGYTAIVNIDPHQLYKIHYYHASTALTAADVGSCADLGGRDREHHNGTVRCVCDVPRNSCRRAVRSWAV